MENNVEGAMRGLKIMFGLLSPKEREILVMRNGLITGEPATLQECAKHFGVTRERIRQIEANALNKIHVTIKELRVEAKKP